MLVDLAYSRLSSMRGLRITPLSTPRFRPGIAYQFRGKPISTSIGALSSRIPRIYSLVAIENCAPHTSTSAIEARRHFTIKATGDALLPSFRSPVLKMADRKGGKQATLGYVRDSQSTIGCVPVGCKSTVIETMRHCLHVG